MSETTSAVAAIIDELKAENRRLREERECFYRMWVEANRELIDLRSHLDREKEKATWEHVVPNPYRHLS